MYAVPAELQRQLVGAQLAGVKQPQHVHAFEHRVTELVELGGPVLAQVPWVVRLRRPRRRQRQQVRRRNVGHPSGAEQRAEMLQHTDRILHVLDRLQEDDVVELAGGAERLHQPALKRQTWTAVAQARVLECLRIAVDTDYRPRAPGKTLGPVALPAGHVEHVASADPVRDPFVHGQVPAEPVILSRHIRKSSLSCELQRRHAGWLVLLNVGVRWHRRQGNVTPAMEALKTADEIRDVNTRYHDVAAASYDSKWGIDFGSVGQAQVLGTVRKLLGPELRRGYAPSLE